MLMEKTRGNSLDQAHQAVPAETVVLPTDENAANASRWSVGGAFARRMRRQRRMQRAARRPMTGWAVRAW